MMQFKDFNDFMTDKFTTGPGKCVLDDEFPDAFNQWMADLDPFTWLDYGEQYQRYMLKQTIMKEIKVII